MSHIILFGMVDNRCCSKVLLEIRNGSLENRGNTYVRGNFMFLIIVGDIVEVIRHTYHDWSLFDFEFCLQQFLYLILRSSQI